MCRNNHCAAFLCFTALVEQYLLEILGIGRVIAYVKEHLCSENFFEQEEVDLSNEGIFSYTSLLSTNDSNQLRNERCEFFPLKYKKSFFLSVLSFQNCCVLRSAEWQVYDQTLKRGVTVIRHLLKRQITSVGQIFPCLQSPGVFL